MPSPKLSSCAPTKAPPALPHAFSIPGYLDEAVVPQTRPHFEIGDIVWAQARGLPSWPGKIVDETEVGKGQPDDGKVKGGWALNNKGYDQKNEPTIFLPSGVHHQDKI